MNLEQFVTLKQLAGAIFFSLLSLYDDVAEKEAVQILRECVENGSVTDPDAISIIEGIIHASESKDLSNIPSNVLQNILQNRGRTSLDGVDMADEILTELSNRAGGGSA